VFTTNQEVEDVATTRIVALGRAARDSRWFWLHVVDDVRQGGAIQFGIIRCTRDDAAQLTEGEPGWVHVHTPVG
jgi:hypothetical protein